MVWGGVGVEEVPVLVRLIVIGGGFLNSDVMAIADRKTAPRGWGFRVVDLPASRSAYQL